MKKSLIALTVASAAASTAYAVDLDDPTSVGAVNYASEITLSGTGVEVATAETVDATIGFTVTSTAPRFFRYDLTNGASFVGNPVLTVPGAAGIVTSAGGDGEAFVLFEVAATATVPNTTVASLAFSAAPPTASLGLNGSTTVQYQMFEFGAGGGNGLLASAGPNTLAAFTPALTVATSTVTGPASTAAVEATKDIEVAANSLEFEATGGTTTLFTSLGSLRVAEVNNTPSLLDGSVATIGAILSSHSIEVDGDFTWAANVFLALDATGGSNLVCETSGSPGLLAGTINTAGDQVTFAPATVAELGDVGASGTTAVVNVCVEADGTTAINEGDYTGTYLPVAATGFTVADVPFNLNSLGNTGQTQILNLTLSPTSDGGVYRNFVRVSNTSSTAGRVFFRLINDAGESSPTVTLGDVTGGSDIVVAQGSSQQININLIYAAVQAVDPTFSIGASPSNKLRTVVTGEFGSMDVQTYTVSLDNNTFSTF
jgi:hypothetical protein